jgi:hypothetical protein
MKKIITILLLSLPLFHLTLLAQTWTVLGDNIIPSNHRTWSLKIAKDNSMWAISTFDRFPPLNTLLNG